MSNSTSSGISELCVNVGSATICVCNAVSSWARCDARTPCVSHARVGVSTQHAVVSCMCHLPGEHLCDAEFWLCALSLLIVFWGCDQCGILFPFTFVHSSHQAQRKVLGQTSLQAHDKPAEPSKI